MVQFYFLSVLANLLAGLILVYGSDLSEGDLFPQNITSGKEDPFGDIDFDAPQKKENLLVQDFRAMDSMGLRLVVGLLSLVVGVVKLFSVYQGVPVAGDLLPVLAGLLGGISLLLEYLVTESTVDLNLPEPLSRFFIGFRRYIGVLCLVVGVLHFMAPQIPLL